MVGVALAWTFLSKEPGISQSKPLSIDIKDVPGTFVERITFLEKMDPAISISIPAKYTHEATLGEISEIPASFFQKKDQVLFTCLTKLLMLIQIADRIRSEPVPEAARPRLIAMLRDAKQLESLKGLLANEADQPTSNISTVCERHETAIKEALQKLHATAGA